MKGTVKGPPPQAFRSFQRACIQRLERAGQHASHTAAMAARDNIRAAMRGAGLGRLGNAIGATSDLLENRIHRRGGEAFSASGVIFIRGRSERTTGAIVAYTEGAEISPRRSPWLWIPTDDIPKRVGRYKITPARYRAGGLESRIGPLVQIPGRHAGEALLIVREVSVDRFGRGKARRLPRRGRLGGSRVKQDFIVAFVGIRRTSRSQRVDPISIIRAEVAKIGSHVAAYLARTR